MLKYDPKLKQVVLDERHRWLLIKRQHGPLYQEEPKELMSFELKLAALRRQGNVG